ncbi:hypothetical protein ACOME3_010251 [Neoechinorhynchus agilis]
MHGAGIGGGSFMLVHDRENKKNVVIDSRETAPLLSNTRMFDHGYKHSIMGGLSIAVPGEIAGYWDAHQQFGVLPWRELFQPTIDLCLNGFEVSRTLAVNVKLEKNNILKNDELKRLFACNRTNFDLIGEGDYMKNDKLAKTLKIIAREGPSAFYNGSLSDHIVSEIQLAGGVITQEDLLTYRVRRRSPLVFKLRGNLTLITVPPPAGGSILGFVLKAMQDYTLTEEELSLPYAVGTFYHRLAESMKFAFSRKERLADPDFSAQTTDCRDILSELFLSYAVAKIDEEQTYPIHYYGLLPWSDEHVTLEGGTAHLNILTDSYAVSMTTSINNGFGSKVVGKRTGIIYNNHMHEFWTDFKTCSSNLIHPQRRPISFISPAIVLSPESEVELIIGGAGGAFIPAAIAQVVIRLLWFKDSLKHAIDSRRFAHLLMPDMLMCERGYDQKLLAVLAEKGHRIYCFDSYLSGVYTAVQAIQVTRDNNDQKVIAYSDPRKGGSCRGT